MLFYEIFSHPWEQFSIRNIVSCMASEGAVLWILLQTDSKVVRPGIIVKSRLLKINPGYRLFYKHFLHSTLGERNLKLTREKPGCKLLAARTKLGKVPKGTYMFANSLLRTADWKATVGNLNLKKVH